MSSYTFYLYTIVLASFWRRRKKEGKLYHPKVSVLVPAYNEQNTIGNTIWSILNQTYKNLELIIINDASTDLTPVVLRNHQILSAASAFLRNPQDEYPHIKILKRPKRGVQHGKPAALNDALQLATGDVIAVFDSDTELDADYIETVIPHLVDEGIAGIQTKVRMYNRNANVLTALQDSEFAIFCSVMQQGRDTIGGYCGLGGNGQFVKTHVQIGRAHV